MPASIRAFVDDSTDPGVRGFLHTPETPNSNALVLTHGAGSNSQAPLLMAVADAFCAARLGHESGHVYGTLPPGVDAGVIVDRALPA